MYPTSGIEGLHNLVKMQLLFRLREMMIEVRALTIVVSGGVEVVIGARMLREIKAALS